PSETGYRIQSCLRAAIAKIDGVTQSWSSVHNRSAPSGPCTHQTIHTATGTCGTSGPSCATTNCPQHRRPPLEHQTGRGLADFIDGLANDWQGWPGSRQWRSYVRELQLMPAMTSDAKSFGYNPAQVSAPVRRRRLDRSNRASN